MTEKINWQKELLESGKFNDKFSSSIFSNNSFKIMNFYFNYVDFVWTI